MESLKKLSAAAGMKSSVAILAGGKGTRIKSRSFGLPKPMVDVCGKPILEHQILLCKRHGFVDITLLVEHQNEVIKEYFMDGEKFGVNLTYIVESNPRGTAGALYEGIESMADNFLVLYADTFADIDLNILFRKHLSTRADATIFLHPNDHPADSDLVEINESCDVIAIHPYPHLQGNYYPNLVNAGLYAFNKKSFLQCTSIKMKSDLAKDTFPEMLNLGMRISGYVSPEYIKDMGTPERLDKVQNDIMNGRVERLSTKCKRQAVFLDRDGTIIKEVNHLSDINQLELIPGSASGIHKLNSSGILAICITNQPVIARGDLSFNELKRIHAKLDYMLGETNAYLDRYYVCPHHPDSGFVGERIHLKIKCNCRKPGTELLERAISELNIDIDKSWFVGDSTTDILAGNLVGLRTVLLRTGHGGQDKKYTAYPDYIFYDLGEAIDWILCGMQKIVDQLTISIDKALNSKLILIGGLARSGKSSTARVLSEMMNMRGRKSHVISLDGWLFPKNIRQEGAGVINRYNIDKFLDDLRYVTSCKKITTLEIPEYDRKFANITEYRRVEIHPDDTVIIEGVPALLDKNLLELAALKIYTETTHTLRLTRLYKDYEWRGIQRSEIEQILTSRDKDEIPDVLRSSNCAQIKVLT